MSCEYYKDALIEAAGSGADRASASPSDAKMVALRVHFATCDSCRASFAEEQLLFTAIDAGLRAAANAEVPASLLSRVRASLDEAVAPQRRWAPNWFALAGAAAMVVALFVARSWWRTSVEPKPVPTAAKMGPKAPAIPPPQNQIVAVVPSEQRNSISQPSAGRAPELEVLVPADQEFLLVRYAEQWRRQKRAPLLAKDSDESALAPLQVAPIQIAQLDVKLLAEEHSQ